VEDTLTDIERRRLDEDGFVMVEDLMDGQLLDGLRRRIEELFAIEGERAGTEFKLEAGCRRLANLVDKGEIFRTAIMQPGLLEYVRHVLGPHFKLSSLHARSVNPHSEAAQPLHTDMSSVADEQGAWVCNSVWMLDDFTTTNGALRVVPGSHRWRKLPRDVVADPSPPHPDEILLTGRAGSVVVINAHLWHGGTANRTGASRTAMHAFYARRDRPQQQYQKGLLRPEVQKALSPQLRWLLALDDPLNDRLSAEVAVRSGFMK
jgi:ectoine hydroxylase-related dioxygenase (phytanoyl-CoA dioxygenase family)